MANIQLKLKLLHDIADDKAFLHSVLDKLLALVREQHLSRLKQYETDLKDFESRYRMSSDSFYEKFEAGEMGDSMDFFEWSGLIELHRDLSGKLRILERHDERC